MKLNLTIEYADGSSDAATASTKDLSAFEETFDKAFVSGVSLKIKELGWLAWHALKRRGIVSKDFEPWWDSVEDVDLKGAEDTVPLESSPSTGS